MSLFRLNCSMADIVVSSVIFAASLVALTSTSHFAIKFVEELIELTGLSDISAGFIILSVLTSIPEITVALFAILQGTPAISIGDILGSNVFNIGVVLGILGMLGYLGTCCTERLVELTDILFLTSLIPLLLVIFNVWSPIVGGLLLAVFVANIYFMSRRKMPKVDGVKLVYNLSIVRVFVKLVLAVAVVVAAANFVVSSGIAIAAELGAPPILLGAKVVAIGTSLPELTLDFTAVRRGRVQLAIGDIIGSNLTNLTLVLGLVLVASRFAVNIAIFTEILPFLLVTTLIFWRFLTKGGVSQVGGVILIFTYILFQAIVIG